MPLKPPQRRASNAKLRTSKVTETDAVESSQHAWDTSDPNLIYRTSSMDSSIDFSFCGSSFSSDATHWVCPQCSYRNGDVQNDRCAMCGLRDTEHVRQLETKRANRHQKAYNSWLSLGGQGQGDEGGLEEEEPQLLSSASPAPPKLVRDGDLAVTLQGDSRGDGLSRSKSYERASSIRSLNVEPSGSEEKQTAITKSSSSGRLQLKEKLLRDEQRRRRRHASLQSETSHPSATSHSRTTVQVSNRTIASPIPYGCHTPPISNKTIVDVGSGGRSSSLPQRQPATPSGTQQPPELPVLRHPPSVNEGWRHTIDREQATFTSSSYLPVSMKPSNVRVPIHSGPQHQHQPRGSVTSTSAAQPTPPVRKPSTPVVSGENSGKQQNNASQHTQDTAITGSSFTSASYVEEDGSITVEVVEPVHPINIVAPPKSDNGHSSRRKKHRPTLICGLVTGSVLVAVGIILVIVYLSTGNTERAKVSDLGEGLSPTVPPSPRLPTSPTQDMILKRMAQEEDSLVEQLGLDVSVGGTDDSWVAMVGNNFIRVMEVQKNSLKQTSPLVQIGDDIIFSSPTTGAQLSTDRNRVVVAHSGRMSLYELNREGRWKANLASAALGSDAGDTKLDLGGMTKSQYPTSVSISADGVVVVGGVLENGRKGPQASITIFEERDDNFERLEPILIPMSESDTWLEVKLSHDGNTIAILTDSQVQTKHFVRSSGEWVNKGRPSTSIFSICVGFQSVALSADGNILALIRDDETLIRNYGEDGWEAASVIEAGGDDVSLSHFGDYVALGSKAEAKVELWKKTENGDYERIAEASGDPMSQFGASVALSLQHPMTVLAVGAPLDGKNRDTGSVSLYQIMPEDDARSNNDRGVHDNEDEVHDEANSKRFLRRSGTVPPPK